MPQESRLHANHDIGHLIITQTVSCHLDLDYGVSIYIYARAHHGEHDEIQYSGFQIE